MIWAIFESRGILRRNQVDNNLSLEGMTADMEKVMYAILFFVMGIIYYFIEILWDGSSHWSMFLLGGVCGLLIGLINEYKFTWDMALWKQVLIGEAMVLPLEFVVGCIVNLWLKLDVWDYSHMPFNILGQTSLLFAILFLPVIIVAIVLDDTLRYLWFGEEKPSYKLK